MYFEFYAGHYFRDIPDGYLETLESGTNRLADPALHQYYDRLSEVLRGPLFSTQRFKSVWYLNAGAGRQFAARYDRKRPIALSVRASNERFITDAGERDVAAGTIRSVGRAGYLQYGPGIPMKVGTYRARWVGAINGTPPAGPIGFVDVWAGDHQLARSSPARRRRTPGCWRKLITCVRNRPATSNTEYGLTARRRSFSNGSSSRQVVVPMASKRSGVTRVTYSTAKL